MNFIFLRVLFFFFSACIISTFMGCTSMKSLPRVDETSISTSVGVGDKVSVVLKDGREHTFLVDRIDGDLLIGTEKDQQVQVSTADITEIKVKKFSAMKNTAVVSGAGLVFVVLTLAVASVAIMP